MDDTPITPCPLAEGQSAFDWDVGGSKARKEDLSEDDKAQYNTIHKVAQTLVVFNKYPQEASEVVEELSLMLGAPTEASPPEATIPLPKEVKKYVVEAQKHRTNKMPFLPPLVIKGYRIPKEAWAMLGIVRHPDKIFNTNTGIVSQQGCIPD